MITITDLNKSYQNDHQKLIFEDFNLKINSGEFVSIFGSNGVGKTTLLRIISGLENIQSGNIVCDGKPISKNGIGYIPQQYNKTLLPWYSVSKNIILPLLISGKSEQQAKEILQDLAKEFAISLFWNKYPYNLSGGQQQMAVILRSIINNPELLLMDEPFSSLDIKTSVEIQKKLLEITRKRKLTTLFVSHRLEEGIFLSSRILVLKGHPVRIIKDMKNELPHPRVNSEKQIQLFNSLKKEVSSGIL